LNELGIINPTQIQSQVIPLLLVGNTVLVGQAQTGTGKTAAFGLSCNENQLTGLDVSQHTALYSLKCSDNELTCLNIKNVNINASQGLVLYVTGNPNLSCIEVDDSSSAAFYYYALLESHTSYSENCNYPAGCFTNSIEEYPSNLSIYPNPTNNLIQIDIENYNESFKANLYDFTGKLSETTNSTSLRLAEYPTGIHLLKVAYGNRVEQLKVVKE
jgi:hypothetical protein